MEVLPSYDEATTRVDWLELVSPYLPVPEWRRCCLVSRHFYRHFATRLWLDPLATARLLGLHPNDDLAWYRRFIVKHVRTVRPATRDLVRSLDFRHFALTESGLYSTEASERAISESFKDLPVLFPKLLCLLIDGHPELDPDALVRSSLHDSSESLQLLDLAHCKQEVTPRFFQSEYLRGLVYLDVSHVPGSIKKAVQTSLNAQFLPNLRILKLRNREMDDATVAALADAFQRQLWSLDVSQNSLTDLSLDILVRSCVATTSFRTNVYFQTEGKLVRPRDIGTRSYGYFDFIEESSTSLSFGHPDSFVADSPTYERRVGQGGMQDVPLVRSDVSSAQILDTADYIKGLLLKDATEKTVSTLGALLNIVHDGRAGLTHLCLTGNNFTSSGIERLLRMSFGRIEHLECGLMPFTSPGVYVPEGLPDSLEVYGLLGSAHLFRPVFSSSLRSISMHHSLITHIPTIRAEKLSVRAAAYLAETLFHEQIQRAFPYPFMPSMNHRISSITLTGIPARSSGPLINQIVRFLDLASAQQHGVEEALEDSDKRGPSVLKGLRHLRLELEPDHSVDSPSIPAVTNDDVFDSLDPISENSGDLHLETESWDITSRSPVTPTSAKRDWPTFSDTASGTSARRGSTSTVSGEFLYSNVEGEHIPHQVVSKDSVNGNVFTVQVWVGTGEADPEKPAVTAYMANMRDVRMHRNVGPATPSHVAAGVPWGSHIYYAAWDSIVFPRNLPRVERAAMARMLDVATAIKSYRIRTFGTSEHWKGRIELVTADRSARYQTSSYWR